MRRLAPLALVLAALGATACGGGGASHPRTPQLVQTLTTSSGQRSYRVRLPSGRIVTQAHSPTLAEPPKSLLRATRPVGLSGTVEQYDSVVVSTLPRSAHYVAGYVDGHFANYRQMLGRWPVVIGISVSTRDGADCFDMEPGNPPPSAAGPWARFQFAQHNARPCEYSMLSWMGQIRANLARWHVAVCTSANQTHCVRLWDANWTYVRHLDSGFACTQWTDHSGGLNRDESTCSTWFYRRVVPKPPPPPPPPPKPPKWTTARAFQVCFNRGYDVAWLDRRHRRVPRFAVHPPFALHVACNNGFRPGFRAGWRR